MINILALDQASTCGWATRNGHGTWDLTTRKDESSGMKMIRFRAKLKEICKLEEINLIVYERVAGQHKNSIIHAAKMVAMIETFCEETGIDYRSYSAQEIKKFITGKGTASKEAVVKAVNEKYNLELTDDNIADAVALYYLTKEDLNLE